MGLITVDELKALPVGLKGPRSWPESVDLQSYIDTASTMVENFLDRKIASQSVVETLRGRDSYRLILKEFPATALTSVGWEDDTTGSTGSVDIALLRLDESGILEFKRRGMVNSGYVYANLDWFDRARLYTVTYTAGYNPVPGPVKHAVALQVSELLRPNFMGPGADVPADLVPLSTQLIVDLLDDYRRRTKRV